MRVKVKTATTKEVALNVKEISVERLIQTRQYENARLGLTFTVNAGDDLEEKITAADAYIVGHLLIMKKS